MRPGKYTYKFELSDSGIQKRGVVVASSPRSALDKLQAQYPEGKLVKLFYKGKEVK